MAENSYTTYQAYCQRIGVQPMNEALWRMMYDGSTDNHVAGFSCAAFKSARRLEYAIRTARPKEPTAP